MFRLLETATDDDTASRVVDIGLVALIGASVIAVVLESMQSFEARYSAELYWFEIFTISVFSIEYLLRVWSCVESDGIDRNEPVRSRLRFMFSFHAIIDLLAILPFYLLAFGLFGNLDMRFLRAVRLMRVLKLTRYSRAFDILVTTFRDNLQSLAAAFVVLLTVMLMAATGMYFFEREVQPVAFRSIPDSMWWAAGTQTLITSATAATSATDPAARPPCSAARSTGPRSMSKTTVSGPAEMRHSAMAEPILPVPQIPTVMATSSASPVCQEARTPMVGG